MSDLWGPIAPPKWLSNYETSILNQQMGREAAASFNTAWNASFGREQAGKIQSQRAEQDANLDIKKAKTALELKRQDESKERQRIGEEYALNQSIADRELMTRQQRHFKEEMEGFVKSLSPEPKIGVPYGTPGSPGEPLRPWQKPASSDPYSLGITPYSTGSDFKVEQNPLPSFGGQFNFRTGESGPFDPTYEDYNRAKAEHPALWLDPVTAPTMQKMDQSWEDMEKIRMAAEVNKDRHRAFEAEMDAKNIALDVGTQGINRFGFREDAYHKAPSEIQQMIDGLPNRGRYAADDPISKRLGFSPLNSAGEQKLNEYLASKGLLRIDGANREELRQAELERIRKAAGPGATETLSETRYGTTHKIQPLSASAMAAKAGDAIGKVNQSIDREKAAGTLTPERLKEYEESKKKINSAARAGNNVYLQLMETWRSLKDSTDPDDIEFADNIRDRIDKLSGTDREEVINKIHDDLDKHEIEKLQDFLSEKLSGSGLTPASQKLKTDKEARIAHLKKQIDDRHEKKPRTRAGAARGASTVPPGWKLTEGGEWIRPDNSASQNVQPGPAAPDSGVNATGNDMVEPAPSGPAPVPTTNASLPKLKNPADISRAISLGREAIKEHKSIDAVVARLRAVNVPESEIEKLLAEARVGVKK